MSRVLIFTLLLCWHSIVRGDNFADAISDFDNRDYQNAASKFETLYSKNSKDVDLLFYLARSQYKVAKYKDARSTIDQLIELDPAHLDAHYLAGIVYMGLLGEVNLFRKLGMVKSALKSWKKVVELDAEHVLANYAVFSFYLNAPGIVGGDMDKALDILKTLESISPPYAELANGVLNSKLENFTEAEKHYLKATEMITDRASPFFAIAQFYFQNEKFEKSLAALERYQQAKKIWHDPGDAIAFYFLGSIHANLGNTDLAKENLNKALSSYPNKQIRGLIEDSLDDL